MFFSLKFYIKVVVVLHYVSQKFNSFPLSFSKKAENALAFLHILLTSYKKKLLLFPTGPKFLQNSSLTQASFITAQTNLYNCIVFGKKRFHCYILALNPQCSPG